MLYTISSPSSFFCRSFLCLYTFFEVVGQIWTQKSDFHTLKDPLSQKRCTRAPINEKSQICVFIKMHIHQSLCTSYIPSATQQARSVWSATGKNLMQFLLKRSPRYSEDLCHTFFQEGYFTSGFSCKKTIHQETKNKRIYGNTLTLCPFLNILLHAFGYSNLKN